MRRFVSGAIGVGVVSGVLVLASAVPANALTLTQSSSTTIATGNSVSCNGGGLHVDNSYLRRYHLADFGVGASWDVSSVTFGIELADAGGAATTQPVEVRLYSIPVASALTLDALTPLAAQGADVADSAETLQTVPVSTTLADPAATDLVVALHTPNGQAAGHKFFIGSNSAPQTGPSYILAPDCGVGQPTDLATIGFANMHIVLNVDGDLTPVPPTPTPTPPTPAPADADADGVPDATDQCPSASGTGAGSQQGCPAVTRTLKAKKVKEKLVVKGKLKAGPASGCAAGQKVVVWQKKPGPDKKAGKATTKANGKYKVKLKRDLPAGKKYYATVKQRLVPGTGVCLAATSKAAKSKGVSLGGLSG